jgi:hypothetical protein
MDGAAGGPEVPLVVNTKIVELAMSDGLTFVALVLDTIFQS